MSESKNFVASNRNLHKGTRCFVLQSWEPALLIGQAVITVSDQTAAKNISRILKRNFQLQDSIRKIRVLRGSTIFVAVASSISEERVNFIWTVNRRKKICEADKRVSSYDNIDRHVQIPSTVWLLILTVLGHLFASLNLKLIRNNLERVNDK